MLNFRDVALRRGVHELFAHATFSIFRGDRVGLVGANGAGKSSLLALIRGELTPEHGEFERPPGLALASVAQEVAPSPRAALDFVVDGDAALREAERALARADAAGDGVQHGLRQAEYEAQGGYTAASRAAALLAGLGFAPADGARAVAQFSGGWRVRLALAQALMCRSDVLLLDEPTNHLDLDAVLWLEDWLLRYPGTLVLISHDREFLDRIATRIVSIEHSAVRANTGNYSAFEQERAARLAEREAARRRQEREVEHIQAFIARFRAKASKARQAQSRLKVLERMERILPAHADSPFTFRFLPPARLPRPLLTLDRARLAYGARTVLEDVELSLLPGSRLALLGRNGAGKSTLTRALAGLMPLAAGSRHAADDLAIGYFAQHQVEQLNGAESPLWHVANGAGALARAREAEQRAFLGGFGFSAERVFEPVAVFSGGERARLVLALIIARRPNLLLLDEPTNHLDLEMRQALALALQEYEGALVLVSHDRHLVSLVADSLWLVAQGTAQPWDGDLADYAQWLRRPPVSEAAPAEAQPQRRTGARERRQEEARARARLAPARNEVARLEREIAALAARQRAIEEALTAPALYADGGSAELKRLLGESAASARELAAREDEWLAAMETLERMGPD